MMMFIGSLGMPEIVLILTLALLIFGPNRIPEIARSLGKGFREFKQSTTGFMDNLNQDINNAANTPSNTPAKKIAAPKTTPAPESKSPPPQAEAAAAADSEAVEPMVIDLESETGKPE